MSEFIPVMNEWMNNGINDCDNLRRNEWIGHLKIEQEMDNWINVGLY